VGYVVAARYGGGGGLVADAGGGVGPTPYPPAIQPVHTTYSLS